MDHNTSHFTRWKICCVSALFFLYAFMELNLFNPISPELMSHYNLDPSEFGHFSALYLYAVALCFFPAGLLLDRYSTRSLMLIGIFIATFATFIFACAPNLIIAKIARIVTGMVHGIAFLSAFRMAGFWIPHQRALAMALVSTIGMLGGLLVQTPLTWLSQSYSWQTAVLSMVVLGCVIYVLIFINVKDHPNDSNHSDPIRLSHIYSQFKRVLSMKQNWICPTYTALLSLPFVLLGALWGELYLTNTTTLSRIETAQVISMLYIGKIISNPLVGWYSDKISLRKPLMIAGGILTFLVSLLLLFSHLPFYILAFLFFSLGFFSSTQSLTYPIIAESNSIASSSAAMGFSCVIIMGGAALFQPLFGWALEQNLINQYNLLKFNNFQTAYLMLPIAFLTAIGLSFFIKETYAKFTDRKSD